MLKDAFKKARIPVLASVDNENAPIKVKGYIDRETGNNIVLSSMPKAISPFTGKYLETASNETGTLSALDIRQMINIANCSCGTKHKTLASIARNIRGEKFNCPVCSNILTASVEETDEELEQIEKEIEGGNEEESPEDNDEISEEDLNDLSEDDLEAIASMIEDMEDIAEEDDEDEEDDKDSEELTEEEIEALASLEDMSEEELNEISEELSENDSEEDMTEEEEEILAALEEMAEEDELIDENLENENSGIGDDGINTPEDELDLEETAKVNLLNKVRREGIELSSLDIIPSNNSSDYYVLANNMPVAKLRKENASDTVKNMFDDRHRLLTALSSAVEINEDFTEEVNDDFGVDPLEVETSESDALSEAKDKLIEEASAIISKNKSTVVNRFRQGISTAAVGLNKGLWRDIENPLYNTMYEELSKANVTNPEKMIQRIFVKSTEPYLNTVLSKAFELADENDDVRNTNAKFVEEASFRTSEDTTAQTDFLNKLESNQAISSNNENRKIEHTASSADEDKINALRSELGLNKYRNS